LRADATALPGASRPGPLPLLHDELQQGLESDEWVYYEDPDVTDTVAFGNGRIVTITRGGLPDRRYETPLAIMPFAYEQPVARAR
jgi:hypothetical protein